MTSVIPGVTGCYWSSRGVQNSMSFILLFVFQLGLVSLTLIHVIQRWRMTKSHLHAILVKHNIFYYACGLVLSTINALVLMLVSYYTYHAFEDLQFSVLAILATRMHLQLWHNDRRVHCSLQRQECTYEAEFSSNRDQL
ncbi:hypothetical protein P692DRAFT_20838111 [Suillus brevipes Sb2]|nr:hypothetical protein P692DRAFT_20838111 [Suillus brevipes Sb2]